MLLLIYVFLYFKNLNHFIDAQKFRMDYMWAHSYKTFYRLHDLATDWQQARQTCESEGTTLLIPDTLDEIENLKLLMSNMRAHYTGIFIGIHDKFSVGYYVTIRGEPITGTTLELLWAEGRPNDSNGTEHCVVMTREGLFDDRPCSDTYPFICKIYGNETKYNEACDCFDQGYVANQAISKCYKFHAEPLSWHDAYLACKLEEGRLAIINSAIEANIVVGFLGEHLNSNTPDHNVLYLGYSDLMFPYQYRTIEERLPFDLHNEIADRGVHSFRNRWGLISWWYNDLQISEILDLDLKVNYLVIQTGMLPLGNRYILYNSGSPEVAGQTLEDAGYASWSPTREDNMATKLKRCGAISRTGFLQITFCEQPAMFLCERILNISKHK